MDMDTEDENNLPATVSEIELTPIQLVELQQKIIEYITQYADICQARDVEIWNPFYDYYPKLLPFRTINKYDAARLRDEFVKNMLPTIYSRQLTDLQLMSLKIFDMHPLYKRTPEGFELLPVKEPLIYYNEMMTHMKKPNIRSKQPSRIQPNVAKHKRYIEKLRRHKRMQRATTE